MPRSLSAEQLHGVSAQVKYDLEMLLLTARDWVSFFYRRRRLLRKRGHETSEVQYERRRLLELVGLHARSLHQFLYYQSGRDKRNVYARDFFADRDRWAVLRPAPPAWLVAAADAASTQLAYIGLARPPLVDHHEWNPLALTGALVVSLDVFISKVEVSRLSTDDWDSRTRMEVDLFAASIREAGAHAGMDEANYSARVMSAWRQYERRLVELSTREPGD